MTIERSPLDGIRLVALDLDGTLLPESKVLTPRATEVVAALGEAGIAVTLATGKGWNHCCRRNTESCESIPPRHEPRTRRAFPAGSTGCS